MGTKAAYSDGLGTGLVEHASLCGGGNGVGAGFWTVENDGGGTMHGHADECNASEGGGEGPTVRMSSVEGSRQRDALGGDEARGSVVVGLQRLHHER